HPGREKTLNNLARALKARYDQYGEIADLEEAMHLSRAAHDLRSVLDECLEDHPHRGAALSNLAHVIICGFTKGVRTDIYHAISLFRHALAQYHGKHPDHLLSILNLSEALHLRYSMGKGSADLHEAVMLYLSLLPFIMLRRTVVEHCRSRHPHRARSLNRLAGDLCAHFEQSGNIDGINEAVHLSGEALAVCPADGEHNNLAKALKARYEQYGEIGNHRNDLDIALERFQTVLDQCPPGHPHRAAALSNIAHAILYGFTKGVGTDIDYVISLFRSALELRPPGNPDHLLSVFDL
ncbi:hypothetical protein K503DRAFT_657690, partial [Rhizopogon vinicolor AM-OR11-026]